MQYAYICTNYNNAHFTREAVRTLNAGRHSPAYVIVVDNSSEPEDVALLKALALEHPNVKLVLNTDNIGYFPGLNSGIDRMRAVDPTVTTMVVGNNDLEFPEDFGECLVEVVASRPECPRDIPLCRNAGRDAAEPARGFRHQPYARRSFTISIMQTTIWPS